MLRDKEIQKIKMKMLKKGLNQTKLSNLLFIPKSTLTFCLRKYKDLPVVERKLRYWLSDK